MADLTALMEAYANSPSSPGLVEEYLGKLLGWRTVCAVEVGNPTPQVFLPPDKTTRFGTFPDMG